MTAAEETEALMDSWFGEVLDQEGLPHDRLAIDGRVSLLLCDGPERWPYAFLDEDNIPADFVKAMRSSNLEAGPDLAVSSMVPRPIDLGRITGAAGETLERFERWPVMRALFLWILFAWNAVVFLQQPFAFMLAGISEMRRITVYAVIGTVASTSLMLALVGPLGQEGVVLGLLGGFVPFYFIGAIVQSFRVLKLRVLESRPLPKHELAEQAS